MLGHLAQYICYTGARACNENDLSDMYQNAELCLEEWCRAFVATYLVMQRGCHCETLIMVFFLQLTAASKILVIHIVNVVIGLTCFLVTIWPLTPFTQKRGTQNAARMSWCLQ